MATINRTPKKSAMNQYQFLKKIKQNRKHKVAIPVGGLSESSNLKPGFQTSMSEEHPPSPSKLEGTTDECAT